MLAHLEEVQHLHSHYDRQLKYLELMLYLWRDELVPEGIMMLELAIDCRRMDIAKLGGGKMNGECLA